MSDNPYQSPRAPDQAAGVKSGSREDVKRVARYQKGLIVCILVYFILVLSQIVVPPDAPFVVVLLRAVAALVAIVGGTVFVFLLAMKVYPTGTGVLLGILALIPLLGLFVLLSVNGKATTILRQNGIKVNFLGANLADIP